MTWLIDLPFSGQGSLPSVEPGVFHDSMATPMKPTEATPLKANAPKPATTASSSTNPSAGSSSSSAATREYSTTWHAFINELKCLVGIGSLTLPWATKHVGLALSLGGVLLLCYAAWEGIRLLIYCAADVLYGKSTLGQTKGGGAAAASHDEGSGSWKKVSEAAFGRVGWIITFISLTMAQVGMSTSFVDQACNTMVLAFGLERVPALLLLWLFLSGLVMFINPGMRTVAWFSLTALLVYLYIYALMIYYAVQQGGVASDFGTPDHGPLLFQPSYLNVWYGPALFAFEGMGTAVSVYESLGKREPQTFLTIATVSYFLAGIVYCFVMAVGYLTFGVHTQDIILANFPLTPLADSARYILSLGLTCSFVLQMTPVFQACESALPDASRSWAWVPTRIALVGCTVALAEVIPSVEQMVALTGALCFSIICFILPAAFYLKLQPADTPCPTYEKIVCCVLIPLGIAGAIGGVHGAINRE